jgi:hypothetical protein
MKISTLLTIHTASPTGSLDSTNTAQALIWPRNNQREILRAA